MKKTISLSLVFIFLFTNLFAELIYLKDGSMVDAAIISRATNDITVNDGQRSYKIPVAKIKSINKKKEEPVKDETNSSNNNSSLAAVTQKTNPLFKFPPTTEEMQIAQYEAYKSISAMQMDINQIKEENVQMKVIMGISLGAILAATVVILIIR